MAKSKSDKFGESNLDAFVFSDEPIPDSEEKDEEPPPESIPPTSTTSS